ncbi:MAG: acetyl-CoA C-acyltransferase [Hyphomicrobiaceae bacterium]
MSANDVVIVGMARTPCGSLLGELSALPAPVLGSIAIKGALAQSKVQLEAIDQVIMGCVLPAGQGQAPARQAGRKAGIPDSVGALTINKMCGSGMQAIMQGADAIRAGNAAIIVAGGMESMSNAPYLTPKLRTGNKYGHVTTYDHMALDGLEDAYEPGRSMGTYAEMCASQYQFTRAAQDAYAIESLRRAKAAAESGAFAGEVVPVDVPVKGGSETISTDEQPRKSKPEQIPKLRPAFQADGTVTAASSSSISDGAAALVLARRDVAEKSGMPILATLVAQGGHAQAPAWFTTAPAPAMCKAMERAGWTARDVDLFEVNEAFAVVAMAAMRDLDIPHDTLNVNGGACALGHPIGASGARIVVTLINAMRQRDKRRGVAGICIGGGEATAVALAR